MSLNINTEERPWGNFTQFAFNEKCTVKILEVKKGEILSLQSHKHRDELWVALDDGAIVEKDDKKIVLNKGEHVYIPKESKHRLSADSENVRVLEVSFGVFDEKDEIRYEDKYNRI